MIVTLPRTHPAALNRPSGRFSGCNGLQSRHNIFEWFDLWLIIGLIFKISSSLLFNSAGSCIGTFVCICGGRPPVRISILSDWKASISAFPFGRGVRVQIIRSQVHRWESNRQRSLNAVSLKPVRFWIEINLTFVWKSTKNIKNSIQHCGRVRISRRWTNFRICQFHPCCMNTWLWFKFHFLFKLTLSSWHQSGFYGFNIFSSEN